MTMKRKWIIMLGAGALTVLTACSNDTLLRDASEQSEPTEVRLSANLSGANQSSTRATNEQNSGYFATGQNIDIYMSETTTPGSPVTATTDGTAALTFTSSQYWPASGNGLYMYGWYPSSRINTASTPYTFAIQADQSAATATRNNDLMVGLPASNPVARTNSTVPLYFTHLLSKVIFKFEEGAGMEGKLFNNVSSVVVPGIKSTVTIDKLNPAIATETVSGDTHYVPSDLTITTLNGNSDPSVDLIVTGAVTSASSECAVILPPQDLTGKSLTINFTNTATPNGSSASCALSGTLVAGTCYTYTVTVYPGRISLSTSVNPWDPSPDPVTDYADIRYTLENVTVNQIGWVVCTDGTVYESITNATLSGKTPVAMVAYISSPGHGLAYALASEDSNLTVADGITMAGTTKNANMAVVGGTWRLPTVDDYKWMFYGAGDTSNGDVAYSATLDTNEYRCGRLRTRLNALGTVYDLAEGHYYLTSTSDTYVWTYAVNAPSGTVYRFSNGGLSTTYPVRAVLAF